MDARTCARWFNSVVSQMHASVGRITFNQSVTQWGFGIDVLIATNPGLLGLLNSISHMQVCVNFEL